MAGGSTLDSVLDIEETNDGSKIPHVCTYIRTYVLYICVHSFQKVRTYVYTHIRTCIGAYNSMYITYSKC